MNQKQALIAGVLAGFGASVCCVAPFVLLSLGLGGVWVANLTLFEPVRPVFLLLALFFLGLAFRKLYLSPTACEPAQACGDEAVIQRQRWVFWVVATALLGLLAFPWVAPLFY